MCKIFLSLQCQMNLGRVLVFFKILLPNWLPPGAVCWMVASATTLGGSDSFSSLDSLRASSFLSSSSSWIIQEVGGQPTYLPLFLRLTAMPQLCELAWEQQVLLRDMGGNSLNDSIEFRLLVVACLYFMMMISLPSSTSYCSSVWLGLSFLPTQTRKYLSFSLMPNPSLSYTSNNSSIFLEEATWIFFVG